MSKKESGEKIIIEGILYKDKDEVKFKNSKDDIYNSKGGKEVTESVATETVATEAVSQTTQSGIQAIISQVQTQAANLGMGFQLEHTIDHSNQAVEKARPMIVEFIETGTIQETIPEGHSKHGQEIPKVESFLGLKVGEARQRAIKEKNKTDEERAIEKAFIESSRPPQIGDEEKGSDI